MLPNRRLMVWIAAGLLLGLGLAWAASLAANRRPQLDLVSTRPSDGEAAAATTAIEMMFSQPVDLSSLEAHWGLTPRLEGVFQLAGNVVRFVPDAPFDVGQQVHVALAGGVEAAAGGTQLEGSAAWAFHVRQPRVAFLGPSQPPHQLQSISPDSAGQATGLTPPGEAVSDFSIGPGGAQVALVRPNNEGGTDIWTLDLESGGTTQRTSCGSENCGHPAWLPDRQHLAYTRASVDGTSSVWVLPLGEGEAAPFLGDGSLQARDPVWSADGEQVAFADLGAGTLRLHSFATGHDLNFHTLNGLVGSWSPDGAKMVANVLDISQEPPVGTLYVIDARSGDTTPLPLGELVDAGSPTWSPDGDWIAVSARRRGAGLVRGIWIIHPDGSGLTPVADQAGMTFGGPAWSAWGDALLFQGASLESLDSPPGVYIWQGGGSALRELAEDAFAPAWLP
jgi:dipeptidyl aminopeptidase/acylaminoacyl peptidase